MLFDYYFVKVTRHLDNNIFDCPIEYCFNKLNMNDYLPIPRAFRCGNCEYVICIPSHISKNFIKTMEKDGFIEWQLLKKENYDYKDFSNTYVLEIRERVLGEIITEYILTRSL